MVITQLLKTEIYFVWGLKKPQNCQQFDATIFRFLSSFVEAWVAGKVIIPTGGLFLHARHDSINVDRTLEAIASDW